jgi:hypothetical protein
MVAMQNWYRSLLIAACLCAVAAPPALAQACAPPLREVASFNGMRLAMPPFAMAQPPAPNGGMQLFLSPVAVAARAQVVYVADAGRRQVYRIDLTQQAMSVFAPFAAPAAGASAAMLAAPDQSLFVADSAARQVLQYSIDGRVLRRFINQADLARPVGLVQDDAGGLLVADSLYRHVLRFSSLGRALDALKPDEARSIEGLVGDPATLYLLDRLGRQVVVVTGDGQLLDTIGKGVLAMPSALALDRRQRLLVADQLDNTIKVFEHGQLVEPGPNPPRFGRIAALTIEGDTVYVADSARARVVQLALAPPCAKAGDAH